MYLVTTFLASPWVLMNLSGMPSRCIFPFVAFQTFLHSSCTARNENHAVMWSGNTWRKRLAASNTRRRQVRIPSPIPSTTTRRRRMRTSAPSPIAHTRRWTSMPAIQLNRFGTHILHRNRSGAFGEKNRNTKIIPRHEP